MVSCARHTLCERAEGISRDDEGGVSIVQRVMVVVDDPALGLRIAMELAEVGCTVHLVGTPVRARQLAQRRALDMVVVDLRLGDDGDPLATPLERSGPVLMTIAPPGGRGRRRAMVDALDDLLGTSGTASNGVVQPMTFAIGSLGGAAPAPA